MEQSKSQKISVRLPIEDYGWVMRFAAKNGLTASQVFRKALKTYQLAIAAKQKQAQQQKEE